MLRPAILAALAAAPAAAEPVRFDQLRAFRAASGPTVTEGFGRCRPETALITGALSAAGAGPCAPGAIRSGVTFSDDPGPFGHQLYLAAPRFGSNRTTALGQTDPAADSLWIGFDAPVAAVGFTVFQNLGGGATRPDPLPVSVRLFGLDDALLAAFDVSVGARGAFFGAVDAQGRVARVSVGSPLSFDMIDDVRFSRPFAPRFAALAMAEDTPAPGALALFGLGAAAALSRSRRG